jgi:hypothetical protein
LQMLWQDELKMRDRGDREASNWLVLCLARFNIRTADLSSM